MYSNIVLLNIGLCHGHYNRRAARRLLCMLSYHIYFVINLLIVLSAIDVVYKACSLALNYGNGLNWPGSVSSEDDALYTAAAFSEIDLVLPLLAVYFIIAVFLDVLSRSECIH